MDKKTLRDCVVKSLIHSYREIYYVDLESNYYYMVYPDSENAESGDYDNAIDEHFFTGRIHDGDEEKIRLFLSRVNLKERLSDKDFIQYRYRRLNSNKEYEWCLNDFSVCKRKDGVPVSAIMAIKSIDNVMKTEESLKAELREAVTIAEKASRAKSDFLSIMSHDIRTPLSALIGMTAIAQRNIDNPEKLKDYIEKISISGKHLQNLLDQILDVCVIEKGRFEYVVRGMNLLDMIQELQHITSVMFEDRGQSLRIRTSKISYPNVCGDVKRLKQLLINILSNASKYSGDGENISFSIEQKLMPDKRRCDVIFIVKDHGLGMEEEFLQHIYEPFVRVEDSRTSKITGSGLGMVIAKKIVDDCNGTIDIKSELGRGTVFTICLPMEIFEGDLCVNSSIDMGIRPNEFRGHKVMVAEDNAINAQVAKEFFEYIGADVVMVEDGIEAVETFEKSKIGEFSCLILDIQMPRMNGVEATKAIRKMNRADSELPIFPMTANIFTDDIASFKAAGMQECISKPVDQEYVVKLLRKYLMR